MQTAMHLYFLLIPSSFLKGMNINALSLHRIEEYIGTCYIFKFKIFEYKRKFIQCLLNL